jgi:MFS transporter, ACS family, hexuronate transporter
MTPTRFRWFIVFLLFAITIVNYIDRAAISYAIPLIQRELGFSPAESGAILGGFAVDRWAVRIVLTVAAVTAPAPRRPLRDIAFKRHQ